jgi:uncharacterized membrane protein HdeD (DUF308 family)
MASMPTPLASGPAIETLRHKWGLVLALGIGLVLCGFVALLSVVVATAVTVLWVGAMMIVAGVIEIAHGLKHKGWGRAALWVVAGALYVIGGFFAIINPLLASVVLTLVLGIALVAAGIARFLLGLHLIGGGHSGWIALSGLVTFLFGLIILVHWPVSSLYVLGIILGVDLIQAGVGWIGLGMFLKRAA